MIDPRSARLTKIGSTAWTGIEELLGECVHHGLHVADVADHPGDPKRLDRMGC